MSTPSDKTLRLERTKLTPQPPRGGRNTTLIVAVIAGVAAAILAGVWLRGQQQQTPVVVQAPAVAPPVVTTPVVVATKDIAAQTVVTADMVRQDQVTQDKLKTGALGNSADIIGKTTMTAVKAGDQIVNGAVMPNIQQFAGLASMIKPGQRAMTIPLDPVSSVAGFVKPNDHVDILGTFSVNGRTITRTVLQNVLLMATGAQVMLQTPDPTAQNQQNQGVLSSNNNDPNAPTPSPAAPREVPNATVAVSPLDSEKLILALSKGKLMLTLRSNHDSVATVVPLVDETAVTTMRPLTAGGGAPPPPPPPTIQLPPTHPIQAMPMAPPPVSITVVRGAAPSTVTFSN